MSAEHHPVAPDGDDHVPGDLIESADVLGGSTQADDVGPAAGAEPADELPAPNAAAERRALLELLIYAWDRARSPGVWERLTVGLDAVGVTVERPDGAPFDAARHEVGGVQPTQDESLIDTVAETEMVGFTDRGTVLREPIVVVYRRG